jgi:hypothetical protein
MNKLKQPWFMLLWFLLPLVIEAQTWNVNPDYWTATDNLGRTTSSEQDVGVTKTGKYVGMFYWTWHTDGNVVSPVINISRILKQKPSAATNLNDTAWGGTINGGTYWWDEPLFGYYRTTDDWVLRKHAQMLADAGIDVVFFDCTNGDLTWKSSYTELLKVWEQARKDGVKTPQIAFILNFGATTTSLAEIEELYNDLYQPGLYQDLWFMLNGKPLIMAYPEMLVAQSNSAGLKFNAGSSFVGVDACCPSWGNNIGNLTLKLYQWNTDYATTVAGIPLADSTFVNFNDNARLKLNFSAQPAGQYYWELSNATEVVGVWKWNNTNDPVTSYYNGNVVTDGNYDSEIYYASQTSGNLTTDNGTGHTAVQIPPDTSDTLIQNIKDFFSFRPGQPDYVSGPSRNDQWGWLEDYPQHGYGLKVGGGYEEATVGVSQNACAATGGHCSAFNRPDSYGRSYTYANGQNSDTSAYVHGYNFQEQWSQAFQLDPDLVFVTGWNEWIAGRWDTSSWPNPYAPFSFVDEYNWEKSRDIEPVKSWGDNGDNYYMQLVSNVRKFKGMQAQESVSVPKTISMGNLNDWTDVKPEYLDYKGDTMWRNASGQGNIVYTDSTGRNDIIMAKVARDTDNLYFYVETADTLTPKTDPQWMRLWIDIDRNKSTGWEGYDYVINRITPGDSAVVERSVNNSWKWEKVGSAAYVINGNVLELKVNRSLFKEEGKGLNFEFKWSDNSENDGNIMDFYIHGDAAPDGRFNYVYTDSLNTSTGTNEQQGSLNGFSLLQNYPNPFKSSTQIEYSIPQSGTVILKVYNLLGQEVTTLVNQEQKPGSYSVTFDASTLASGIYMYRIEVNGFYLTKKMVLVI